MGDFVNNIRVIQNIRQTNGNQTQNEYHFYSEAGFYFGGICLPFDRQFWLDAKVIAIITKVLAIRWKLIQGKLR